MTALFTRHQPHRLRILFLNYDFAVDANSVSIFVENNVNDPTSPSAPMKRRALSIPRSTSTLDGFGPKHSRSIVSFVDEIFAVEKNNFRGI